MSQDRPDYVSASAFEHRYRRDPDPWNFAGSDYERARYRAIIDALPRSAYLRAFEPGCSVGELTAELAEVCEQVLATDIAPSAVMRACERCAELPNVDIRCADLASDLPKGPFDLIVFSEIGYYFTAPHLDELAVSLADRLTEGGDFVAVHWLGDSEDHLLHGDQVHEQLALSLPLTWLRGDRHSGFRVDSWRRS